MQSMAEAVIEEVGRIVQMRSRRAQRTLKELERLGYFQRGKVDPMTKTKRKVTMEKPPEVPQAPPATPESVGENPNGEEGEAA